MIGLLFAIEEFLSSPPLPSTYQLNGSKLVDNKIPHKNEYGDGYGKQWIFFPDEDGIPHFVNLSAIPPMPRLSAIDEIDIEYRLYTRDNKEDYILLDKSTKPLNESSDISQLDLSNTPIKVLTHGWKSSADMSAVINIKNAYLNTQNVIVIAVDWSTIAGSILYPVVALETKSVGHYVAQFLNSLNERHNVSGNQLHLIGHSLGAHVMGNAASESHLKVARITGLDPARPFFEIPNRRNSTKLDSEDAQFVDVIHTCGGILGVEEPVGNADFFPNSGFPPQPGCDGVQYIFEACSHSRSHFYFAESIKNPNAFPAYKCNNWTDYLQNKCSQYEFMGNSVSLNSNGKFYLKTNNHRPYGRGLQGENN